MANDRSAAGTLRINTTINDAGIQQGLNRMSASLRRFVSNVVGGAQKADNAWKLKNQSKLDTLTQKFNRQTEAIQKQSVKVSQLDSQLRALGSAGNEPKSMLTMEKEIRTLEKNLSNLIPQFNKLSDAQQMNLNLGQSPNLIAQTDAELERLGEIIRRDETRAAALKAQLQKLRTNPQVSNEGKILAERLALAQQHLDKLKRDSDDTNISLTRLLGAKPPHAEKGVHKLVQSLRNAKKETEKTGSGFDMLGRKMDYFKKRATYIAATAFVFYHLRQQLIKLSRYMYGMLASNKAFMASLGAIRTNLMTAFAPIFTAILPAINALMRALATLSAYIASFFSMIFGTSVSASNKSAKALDKQSKALQGVGGSAKDAKGELAAFDEIEVLDKKDEASGGGGSAPSIPVGEYSVSPETQAAFDTINAWLQKVWEYAEPARKAVEKLWKSLKRMGGFVWKGLVGFYDNFLVPVGKWVLGTGLPSLITTLSAFVDSIDWDTILTYFDKLWKALAPYAAKVGENILWFFNNVLVPLGQWVINDAVPAFLNLLTNAVNLLGTIIDTTKPAFEAFYNNVLVPLGNWAGQAIIDALNWLSQAFKDIGTWMDNHQELVKIFTDLLIAFAAAWVTVHGAISLVTSVVNTATAVIGFLTNPITLVIAAIALLAWGIYELITHWEDVKKWAIDCWEKIKATWNTAAAFFDKYVIQPIVNFFVGLWNNLVTSATTAWEDIKLVWDVVSGFFKTYVIDPLVNAWNTATSAISKFFSDAWEAIKKAWNGVVKWFNDLITNISDGFNTVTTSIGNWFSTAWDNIKKAWQGTVDWFNGIIKGISDAFNTVTSSIGNWFTTAWDNIKKAREGAAKWFDDTFINPIRQAFRSVATFITNALNSVIGVVNNMIGGVEKGINYIVSAINSIGFTIPPIDIFGKRIWDGVSVSPNIAPVSFGRIATIPVPKFATGAIIPPNDEFMAILGDQRRGKNIEAPEDLIRKIVREETAKQDAAPVPINLKMGFEGDLATLIQILRPYLKREDDRVGTSLIVGGDY
jgi:phage-related protein